MCTISLSLAKPGEAIPAGAVQQLDGASPACVTERWSRLGGPGEKTQDNADTALIRLFTSNKDSGTRRRRGACHCQERDPSVSCTQNI